MAVLNTKNTARYEPRKEAAAMIVIGAGPSLTVEDAALAANCGHKVLVVGDAWRYIGVAADIYHCDHSWWAANIDRIRAAQKGARVTGRLLCLDAQTCQQFGLEHVPCVDQHESRPGLSGIPGAITQGGSSGYQALHIAYNTGVQRIILLGYDYGATGKWHLDGSPCTSDFTSMIRAVEKLAYDIGRKDVKVVNATRETALSCFTRVELADALKGDV